MAARSTNRFKQKPAVPFGDFMLPILGVIALGIVVVGLRILWAPSSPKPTVIAQPRPSVSKPAQSQTAAQEATDSAAASAAGSAQMEEVSDVVIAQPVQKETSHTVQPSSPAQPKPAADAGAGKNTATGAAKPQAQPAAPKPQPSRPAVVRAGSIDKSKFVVQCGSYTDRNAANSVVASLKKMGYTAVVRRADVRGKTYFRVIVAGGNDRALANQIAQSIKNAGHPVLVRAND